MRLIDADMLKEAIKEYFKSYITDSSCMIDGVDCNADICRIVEEQPTVAGENGFRADAVENTEEMVRLPRLHKESRNARGRKRL